jgi:hypothetical protein
MKKDTIVLPPAPVTSAVQCDNAVFTIRNTGHWDGRYLISQAVVEDGQLLSFQAQRLPALV